VDRIVRHPESTFGSNTGSDSALIHVTQPFNIPWLVANKGAGKYYTNDVLNIDTTSPPVGTVFDTYGYSTTWLGTGKAALQQLFTGWYTTQGVNGAGDSCGGDSGGPDFRVTSTKAYHVGIHSNGGCGNGGNSNIRTRYIQPWIKSTTGT
jgi:hypothetical protein